MQDWFDHERLDVYGFALEFLELAGEVIPRRGPRLLRDQLERASMSIVLCIAEGAGRRTRPDKSRFYSMARGSATESAAIFDILKMRKLIPPDRYLAGRMLLLRLVRMLTRLSQVEDAPPPPPPPAPAFSDGD